MENKQKEQQTTRKIQQTAMTPDELERFLDNYFQNLPLEKTSRKK